MKYIFCGLNEVTEKLLHNLLDNTLGRTEYQALSEYEAQLKDKWEWDVDEDIPDQNIIDEWYFWESENILTTYWSYERTMDAIKACPSSLDITICEFCKANYIGEEFPF